MNARNNPLTAYRCFEADVFPISPSDGDGAPLPDELFVSPGNIEIDHKVFTLNEEGIYRFYRLPDISEQRIVHNGSVNSLLQMVGFLWVYGKEQENESADLFTRLPQSCAVASCTNLAILAEQVLYHASINSRVVAIMTAKGWGGYDDGHTMLEIYSEDSGWFLYDPSFSCCFIGRSGRLSLLDFVNAVHQEEPFHIEKLPGNCGHGAYKHENYDFGFWIDERTLSSKCLESWYRRIGDIPLIREGSVYYFANDAPKAEELERYISGYCAIDRTAFMRQFYPETVPGD